MSKVVSVLTHETAEAIIAAGGTEPWALDRKRASSSDFLMCCRKSSTPPSPREEANAAFLIGKIKDVLPSDNTEGRWKITISHFALVGWPDQWNSKRKNPVLYWDTEKYPSEDGNTKYLEELILKPVHRHSADEGTGPRPMTVAEAKAGLALKFGVDESAIEITIRM